MTISFLLVNFNMKGLIEQCLQSLYAQGLDDNTYEILVADNSTDRQHAIDDAFLERHTRLTLYELQENLGWVHALNALLPKAAGEVVFVMHPDIHFLPGSVQTLLAFLREHPSVGIVSPDILYPDHSPTMLRTHFPTFRSEAHRLGNILSYILSHRHRFPSERAWDRSDDARVEMVMSVCFAVRKQVLARIMPVPASLQIYYANDYMCWMSARLGWETYYVRSASIIHYERFSSGDLYSAAGSNAYKRESLPIVDRMESDKFTFLRFLYKPHYLCLIKLTNTLEYLVHIIAAFKQHKRFANPAASQYWKTIRAIWSPK